MDFLAFVTNARQYLLLETQEIFGVRMPPIQEDNETAFAELVRQYENMWIAIKEKDGVRVVVGFGRSAIEAVAAADANGFPDAALFKVPSFSSSFVP